MIDDQYYIYIRITISINIVIKNLPCCRQQLNGAQQLLILLHSKYPINANTQTNVYELVVSLQKLSMSKI